MENPWQHGPGGGGYVGGSASKGETRDLARIQYPPSFKLPHRRPDLLLLLLLLLLLHACRGDRVSIGRVGGAGVGGDGGLLGVFGRGRGFFWLAKLGAGAFERRV